MSMNIHPYSTDHVILIEARRSNLIVLEKKINSWIIVDVGVPGNIRVDKKGQDKLKNTKI